jgi:hypothetical protein
MWPIRRQTRIQIGLGYGVSSIIRCLNVLLGHRVQVQELTCKDGHCSSIIPIALEVTIKHPGHKRMETIVAALNQVSYGCREVDIDSVVHEKTERS